MADNDLVQQALSRGYSIDEIADKLSAAKGIDPASVRERGYSSSEMLQKFGYSVPAMVANPFKESDQQAAPKAEETPAIGNPMGDDSGAAIMAQATGTPPTGGVMENFDPSQMDATTRAKTQAYADQFDPTKTGFVQAQKNRATEDARQKTAQIESQQPSAVPTSDIDAARPAPGVLSTVKGIATDVNAARLSVGAGLLRAYADAIGDDDLAVKAETALRNLHAESQSAHPTFESAGAEYAYQRGSGLAKGLTTMVGALGASALAGPEAGVAAFAVPTAAETYGEKRADGFGIAGATAQALSQGGIAGATMMIPMRFIGANFGKQGVGEFVSGLVARDIPMFEAQAIGSSFVEHAGREDETLGDWLKTVPAAMRDAAVDAVLFSAAVGGAHGAKNAAEMLAPKSYQIGKAMQGDIAERDFSQANNESTARQSLSPDMASPESIPSGQIAPITERSIARGAPGRDPMQATQEILSAPDVDTAIAAAQKSIETPISTSVADQLRSIRPLADDMNAMQLAMLEAKRKAEEARQTEPVEEGPAQSEITQPAPAMQAAEPELTGIQAEVARIRTAKSQVEPQAEAQNITDRRQDNVERQRVDAMTPDEMRRALLTSDLTGLPNKRAFEEHVQANPQDKILFGDLDDFKAMNEKLGHEGADQVLQAVGAIKAQIAERMGVTPFHRSGDEFLATNADDARLNAYGKELQDTLARTTFHVTMPDGAVIQHKGVGFSYGTDQNVKLAESRSLEQKAERKQLGLRTGQRDTVEAPELRGADNQGNIAGRDGTANQGLTQLQAEIQRLKQRAGTNAPDNKEPLFSRDANSPTKEQRETIDAVKRLNDALRPTDGRGTIVPLRNAPSPEFAAARDVAKRAFGKTVHFIEDNPHFDGVAHRGEVFLTPNEKHPALALAGHEVSHALEQSDPVRADGLKSALRQYLKGKALSDKAKSEQTGDRQHVESEVVADLHGAMWLDHRFWSELLKHDPNLFRAVAYKFMEAATKMVEVAKGSRFDASRIVSDVDAVRTLIAKTWAEHNQDSDNAPPSDDVRYSRKDRDTWYYSHLSRSIEQAPDRVFGPPKQFKAWLDSNAAKLGIKKDELAWSGIGDWLNAQTGKISKEQVIDFLRSGGVQVREVEKGGAISDAVRDAEAQRQFGRPFDSLSFREAAEVNSAVGVERDNTKYSQYVLPGGENYRELLLTLPHKPMEPDAAAKNFYEMYIQKGGEPTWQDLPPERRAAITETMPDVARNASAPGSEYRSSHWDEPNVLAHVRFNDRTDANGKRVLFIEEMQSDWAQEGKKKGFSSADKSKPIVVFNTKTGETLQRFATGIEAEAYIKQNDSKMESLDYEDTTARHGMEKDKIVNAPFVTDTKAWLSLGIKRMIRYAAEHGYDKIAFVNGEQSADRYDLSKQVDRIVVVPRINAETGEKTRGVNIDAHGQFISLGVDKNGIVDNARGGDFVGKRLDDVVGKEMADRIMHSERATFEGDGLKVGGEGMKSFYDKIVPQVASDVLKKLGGGKVDGISIVKNTTGEKDRGRAYEDSKFQYERFERMRDAARQKGKESEAQAAQEEMNFYADAMAKNKPRAEMLSQIGFDITPELRAKAMEGMPLFSKKEETSDHEERRIAATSKLAEALKVPRAMVSDLKLIAVPMAEGSDVARKVAKDYANQERRAQWQWKKFDDVLTKNFSEEQLAKMWNAADEENDLRREGVQDDTRGLGRLDPEERKVVETLHAYGEELISRARDNGMFEGEGVPYWTPRMAVMVGESGEYSRPITKGDGGGEVGRNITTSASSLKQRKYLTSAETEAAMKARLDEGDKTAQLVRNIRTMPMAMARLERAIAGRELINQIKAIGQATGRDTVLPGAAAENDGYFTLDHPAFKTWRPDFKDGEIRKDENGDPIMVQVPLKISNEFKGPLKAVMSTKPGEVYLGLMALKSKSMGLIMYSPIIHNAVEWGRAIPAMDTKGKLTLGLYTYVTGNRAKHDPVQMREAIDHGLVPIGGRGQHMDITGIMEDPTLQPGRSWTAQVLAAPVSLISERGATNVKKAVDAAGKFWHETLLWDRVADLQMGLYVSMKSSLINKGLAETDAATLAAHFANRYAGALPREAMSEGARQILNLTLFSRTFTMGNLGAMKDMIAGLPKDVQAQIRMNSGELALKVAQNQARKKAVATFIIDVGLMYVANSLMQDWFEREKIDGWSGWMGSYAKRGGALYDKLKTDPVSVLAHPFNSLESLSSTGENEQGKEERIKWGEDSTGTEIYVRMPTGKIGEEFANYANFPAGTMKQVKAKFSTFLRPLYETITNEKGAGQKVYDDSKDASTAKNVGKVVVNFLKAQVPSDQIAAVYDLTTGHGDDMDVKKIVGPLVGLTFSKGAPGGPAVGEMYAASREHQDKVIAIMPDVKRAIKLGDEDKARELMESVDMTQREINTTLNHIENPESRLSRNALKQFNKHATDEQKERMNQLRR